MRGAKMARNNFLSLWKNEDYAVDLEKIFGEEFQYEEENKTDYYRDFVYLEFLFYSHTKVFNTKRFSPKNPIAIFSGHDELIYYGVSYDWKLLNKTVFLTKGIYHKKEIEKIADLYFSTSEHFRLFKIDGEHVVFNAPKICSWRTETYDSILFDPKTSDSIPKDYPFVTQDHKKERVTIFKKYKSAEERKREKLNYKNLPEVFKIFETTELERKHEFLLEQLIERRLKKKRGVSDLNSFLPNETTYEKMGGSFSKRFQDLEVYQISERVPSSKPSSFYFHNINHVLAATGAGKSTLSYGLCYSLVHTGKKKIMIWTNNTQQTMQEKQKLEDLGLKVGVIIGNSKSKEHLSVFIKNTVPNLKNPNAFELLDRKTSKTTSLHNYRDDLNTLHNQCLIREYFDLKQDDPNPCKRLAIPGERTPFACPLYSLCPAHYKYQKLLDADIWIGTPEAFAKSSSPYQWDSKERSFLELGVLWGDVIIIDEVDNIQKRLDQLFIDKLGIVADDKEKVDSSIYFAEYLFEIVPKVVKSKTKDSFVGHYLNKVNELQSVFYHIYGQILSEYHMIKYLRKKPFTSYGLLKQWFKMFCKTDNSFIEDESNFLQFYKPLIEVCNQEGSEFRNEPVLQMEFLYLHQKLKEVSLGAMDKEYSILQRDLYINTFLEQFSTKVGFELKEMGEVKTTLKDETPEEKERKRNRRFEFLLFLLRGESLIYYLRTRYDNFINRAELKDSSSFSKDFIYKTNEHQIYTPSPLTDTFSVYRLVENKGQKEPWYSFENNEYKGIGRNLMSRLNRIFEGIEDTENPALLFLSATSDIPHSSHFGVGVEPNWLLENKTQKEQEIKITVCAVSNGEGGYYQLSGEEKPAETFQNITLSLLRSGYFDSLYKEHKQLLDKEQEEVFKALISESDPLEKAELLKAYTSISNESVPAIGIVVKSYQKVEWIAKTLIKHGMKQDEIKVLYTNEPRYDGKRIDRLPYHITINEIEDSYKYRPKFIILVREAIQRAYNVLAGKDSKRSLIRTMCFYERPHPVPGQFEDAVMFINAKQPLYLKKMIQKNLTHYEAEKFLNQKAHGDLHDFFVSAKGYSSMDEDEQRVVAANELVPTLQTSGRGMRGGTSLHVITFDFKMAPKTFATNSLTFIDMPKNLDELDGEKLYEDSMMARWKEILVDSNDALVYRVHKPWIKALQNINVKYIKGEKDND